MTAHHVETTEVVTIAHHALLIVHVMTAHRVEKIVAVTTAHHALGKIGLHVAMIVVAMIVHHAETTAQPHGSRESAQAKVQAQQTGQRVERTYSQVTLLWEKLSGELTRVQEKAAERASQDLKIVRLPAKT
jgi:hypothetical protein